MSAWQARQTRGALQTAVALGTHRTHWARRTLRTRPASVAFQSWEARCTGIALRSWQARKAPFASFALFTLDDVSRARFSFVTLKTRKAWGTVQASESGKSRFSLETDQAWKAWKAGIAFVSLISRRSWKSVLAWKSWSSRKSRGARGARVAGLSLLSF